MCGGWSWLRVPELKTERSYLDLLGSKQRVERVGSEKGGREKEGEEMRREKKGSEKKRGRGR